MKHYAGVQALRGLGAVLVVFLHITVMLQHRMDPNVWQFTIGAAGVDLFFAISGFIMVITTASVWGQPGHAVSFIKRRLIRVMPLYWIATTLKLTVLFAAPHVVLNSTIELEHTIKSYLLIPAWNKDHQALPLLTVGWTLYYEMFFYLLFTATLALKLNPLKLLTPVLIAGAVAGLFTAQDAHAAMMLFSPVLLEFLAGMWVAALALKGHLPSPRRARLGAMLACGILFIDLLCFNEAHSIRLRVLVWGIPMVLLLYCVVALQNHSRLWRNTLIQQLGDASYAIYLFHGFVIPPVGILIDQLQLSTSMALLVSSIACLYAACIAGILIHRFLEKPLLRYLRSQFEVKTVY